MAYSSLTSERGVVFPPRRILVIDRNVECARLLACALHRDFPQAEVHTSVEADTAAHVLATSRIDAVVLHRTLEHDAASLIRVLRGVREVPMIAVCEDDCKEQIFAAGATACVGFDDWPADDYFACARVERRVGAASSWMAFHIPFEDTVDCDDAPL